MFASSETSTIPDLPTFIETTFSMFKYTVSYLMLTAIFGVLGFVVLADAGAFVTKIVFSVFLTLFVGSLLYRPERRRSEI